MALTDFFQVNDQGFVQIAPFDPTRPDLADYFPAFRTALASTEVSQHLGKAHELIESLKEGPTQEALDHLYQATKILKRALLGQAIKQADIESSTFTISEGGLALDYSGQFTVGEQVAILIIHTPELRSTLVQGVITRVTNDHLTITFEQISARFRQNLAARLLKLQAQQR